MMQYVVLLYLETGVLSDKISMETHLNLNVFRLIGICCMCALCTGPLGLPVMFLNV